MTNSQAIALGIIMSTIKSLAIYGVINGRPRVARGGGVGGVVGGAAPGSARVMGAVTGAPGVLREGGPALTQYGGGELQAHPQPAGYFCTPWLRWLQSGSFVAIFRQQQDRLPHGM